MKLWKAHGLGNDYLVWEGVADFLTAERVKALCNRHTGVGADGILEPVSTLDADYGLVIWNPDGTTAEKSGNGLRIFARWLHQEQGASPSFSIAVGGVVVHALIEGETITIDMGQAQFEPEAIPVSEKLWQSTHTFEGGETERLCAVGMGNPHCVVMVSPVVDLDALPWRRWGAELEMDPRFPNRTNVQFAQVVDVHTLRMRIWERGAGETSASGSSSCAVAAVAVKAGWCQSPLRITMPGGVLSVAIDMDFNVRLKGPVVVVGRVELDSAWRKLLVNLESE
ncbi:MAG: diaminopimelate epimerase [Myxococcota bacterium]